MLELENEQNLVIGLDGRGQATCEFLRRSGVKVVSVDNANNQNLRQRAHKLSPLGVEVMLGVSAPPERDFNLAVLTSLKTYVSGPHHVDQVAEIDEVQFINDSKASNVDALHKSMRTTRPRPNGEPNLCLIADGKDKDSEFEHLGPRFSIRAKRAFLVDEASERIRAAWSSFTPCTVARSLLEAVTEAAKNATSGDVVLLAPACSSWDRFQNHQHRGEVFCQAVKSIGRGVCSGTPNIHGKTVTALK